MRSDPPIYSTKSNPSLDTFHKCATAPNDELVYFIAGGNYLQKDDISDIFVIYDINANQLINGPPVPNPVEFLGCEYINNKVVIFGGRK